ncbi:unnamed protein product [Ixodes hexagonus]
MFRVRYISVILATVCLWSGSHALGRRRRTKEVSEACKTEGVRVSECRAAFFAELQMLERTNRNFQHTNCTLYSKLECCLVTEYGIQGCLDKNVITKAIANAVHEHQSYDNCPKGLCDPSSMNGSFKIMRDMDENLHGRESVSRLIGAHRRKVKREVDPNLDTRPSGGTKETKSYVEEHLKSSKHKSKKKLHKRSHKNKKVKKPKVNGDEPTKDEPDLDHAKNAADVQVITPKTNVDDAAISGSISNSSNATTTFPINTGVSDQPKVEVALKTSKTPALDNNTGSLAVTEKNRGPNVTSGFVNHGAVDKKREKHDMVEVETNASNIIQPNSPPSISIEVIKKNPSLSELGKMSRKSRRRRKHHKVKQTTRALQDTFLPTKPSVVGNAVLGQDSLNATNASQAQLHGVSGSNLGDESKIATASGSENKAADLDSFGNQQGAKINASLPDTNGAASEGESPRPAVNETKNPLEAESPRDAANRIHPTSSAPLSSKDLLADAAVPNIEKFPFEESVLVHGEAKSNGKFDTAQGNKSTADEKKVDAGGSSLDAETGSSREFSLADGKTTKAALPEKPKLEKDTAGSSLSADNSSATRTSGHKEKPVNSSLDANLDGKRDKLNTTITSEANSHKVRGTIEIPGNKHSDLAPKIQATSFSADKTLVEISGNLSLVEKKDDDNPILSAAREGSGKNRTGAPEPGPSGVPATSAPIAHEDVPAISLDIHMLERKRDDLSFDGSASIPELAPKHVIKNDTKSGESRSEAGVPSTGGFSNESVNSIKAVELPEPSLESNVSGGVAAPSSTTRINLKEPKHMFGSGPLIEVRGGHKGGTFEKQVVHSYETGVGERSQGSKVKNSLVDDLMDQYGSGASDYDFHYARDSKRSHKQRFRDDDEAPKVRRRQSDGDEPFETDTTKDPFQEYSNSKDGDTRGGGLYVADRGRRQPADENVKVARHKKVHRRKPDTDYNYESVVRWKLLEELDSILDPKNSANVENLNKPMNTGFGREKDDDMDQWRRRLEPANVHVEAQSGERIVSSHDDAFRDADAMRDGEMYYRKYRRQGPIAFGAGYEGVERPIIKDPIIHQVKKRFWIERQESSNASNASNLPDVEAHRSSSADIHLKPLPRADGTVPVENPVAGSGDRLARTPGNATSNETSLETRYPSGAPSVNSRSALEPEDHGRRLTNRRAARSRRLRGSRGSRKLHKNLKDTEGLKILRNDDLQGDDDDDDDDDADDDDDDEDDEELKDLGSLKKSTTGIVTQQGQVGRVDAAERPLMSFGERIRTNEPTRPTPKKDIKPSGSLIGGAESPDCVPDTLRAHTDYCRGIYTKHQKSIDEARKTTSKKTMACYKLESIKGCLSAGSYFSKCLGANNNEFQDLQGSVMGQMRDLHCGASAAGNPVLLMLVTLAVVYLVRQEY